MSPNQRQHIDDLLRQLWLELRSASADLPAPDLHLFEQITAHEAIQSRLSQHRPPPVGLKQTALNLD